MLDKSRPLQLIPLKLLVLNVNSVHAQRLSQADNTVVRSAFSEEQLLQDVGWQLSCPKRSTPGAYLLAGFEVIIKQPVAVPTP